MGGKGYLKGLERGLTVHGYVFLFKEDEEFISFVRDRVEDIFYDVFDYVDWGNKAIVIDAEERERVDREEVRGVGFYFPRILINDILYEKADIRFRFWRTIRIGAVSIVRGIIRVSTP
jgi:uncharacterized protein YqgQ